jgi:hypothetical protein
MDSTVPAAVAMTIGWGLKVVAVAGANWIAGATVGASGAMMVFCVAGNPMGCE